MKTTKEILAQYEKLSGRKGCLSEAQLKDREIRELVENDVYALIDFNRNGKAVVTHYVWFTTKENAIKALEGLTLRLSQEPYQCLSSSHS